MWIFTKDGFVSAVAHDTDPDLIRVRARKREHLVHSLGPVDVIDFGSDAADYRFHADVDRADFAAFLVDAVENLDYTSHVKEEIAGDDKTMYRAMLSCWTALRALQVQDRRLHNLRSVAGTPDSEWQ